MLIYARLTKVDEALRRVSGVIASEALDRSKEVFDYDSSKPHFEAWSGDIAKATDGKSLGNVRAMHGKVAAGRLMELEFNDTEKTISVDADIVDDNEWEKVTKGLYTGFSIGGKYERKWTDSDGQKRYTAIPHEVSLVDLPCNKDATFTVIKAAGGESEERAFDESVTSGEADATAEAQQNESGEGVSSDAEAAGDAEKAAGAQNDGASDDDTPDEGDLRVAGNNVEKFVNGGWTAIATLNKDATLSGEVVDEEELRKSAYSVSALARLAEDCRYLGQSRAYEVWDGTGNVGPIPDSLKAAAIALYDALVVLVNEDADKAKSMIAEKVIGLGIGEEELRKGVYVLGEEDRAALAGVDALTKALGVENFGGVVSAIEKLTQDYTDLRKRWDALPADPKGVLRTVDKSEEVSLTKGATSDGDGTTATASVDASQDTDTLMRKSLSSGVRMHGIGR